MQQISKKPYFIATHITKKMRQFRKKRIIPTWSRSTTIIPSMIGYTFGVHNGRRHIPIFISGQMVGHKLGEFSPTRTFRSHRKKDKKLRRKF